MPRTTQPISPTEGWQMLKTSLAIVGSVALAKLVLTAFVRYKIMEEENMRWRASRGRPSGG